MSYKYMIFGLIGLLLSACSHTQVFKAHPALRSGPSATTVKVYFVRPPAERPMGIADNPVLIRANGSDLLTLASREYTLIYMKAGVTKLETRNETRVGHDLQRKEMKRSKVFRFAPGQTYVIGVKPRDGEFRGLDFLLYELNAEQRTQAARYLRPVGLAHEQPLTVAG